MRVLVVGGGGREHALVHSFVQSSLATQVFCAPGNAGIAAEADCVPIGAEDVPALLEFALKERPDLTVIGPEAPLVAGVTDLFRERDLLVFGPDARAARMEGSKVFAKEVMGEAGAPTGGFSKHTTAETALAALARQTDYPVVVKADGLAAGKGVIIAEDASEARAAVEDMLVAKSFGGAGEVVVIEEHLVGSEVSLLVLCDGETAVPLAPAQDYKRIFAGDQGPEHRRHGQLLPGARLRAARHRRRDGPGHRARARDPEEARHHLPWRALRRSHRDRRRDQGPGVQLPLRGPRDAGRAAAAAERPARALPRGGERRAGGGEPRLDAAGVRDRRAGVGRLPRLEPQGRRDRGAGRAAAMDDVTVYHAGTAFAAATSGRGCFGRGDVVTAGGRVLAVSALGDGFAEARERAYQAVAHVRFEGMQSRPDIAERAVRAEAGEISLFPTA